MIFNKNIIIDLIKKSNNASFFFLVRKLNIHPSQNRNFSFFLNDLKKQGLIAYSKKNENYYIPELIENINCNLNLAKSNDFGFVLFEVDNQEKKAIIFKENLNNAISGDLVNVDIFKEQGESQMYFAIVKKIIERKQNFICGSINTNKEFEPINFSNKYNFHFDKNKVKENTYVKFEIQSINKNDIFLDVYKEISNINQPYSDIELITESFGVDKTFNSDVLHEAQLIPDCVSNKTSDNRVDLTNELIVTIDGEKTKDFDDAILVKKTKNNTYILSVHIADVAYYVKENSAIDKQALSRATSIYLLDKVIPMLPEKLSNGICSLNPNVDRYTLSLEVEINKYGNVMKKNIFPATINSKYRLTYNQVANYKNEDVFKKDPQLFEMIENAYELSNILSKAKYDQGYIDFEIQETVVELDSNGKSINIKNKERLSSEVLIENFMVLANEVVSKIIADLKVPSIYRIHEAPSEEKFQNLEAIIKILNLHNINVNHSTNPKDFSMLVEKIKEQRFDDFVKISLLRTMQKAKYSTNNIGHFGLASKYYSHFTSPIRRYPDLALHRIIWELIIKKNYSYTNDLESKLNLIAKISSQKEEESLSIERKVIDVKKAEFYERNVTKIFDATIVSIQKFGIFVELSDGVDVMIHTSRLSNEICLIDENNTVMKCGEETSFKLGQKIKIQIISINKLEGKIDGQLVK